MGVQELIWSMTLLQLISSIRSWDQEVGVVAGAHFHPLNKVTVYSSSVPLNFQVPWPRRLADDSSIINQELTCTAGMVKEFCSIDRQSKHFMLLTESLLHAINDAAGEDLTIDLSLKDRVKRGITFIGDALNWCCDVATSSQVNTLFSNEKELARHLELINNEVLKNHANLANFTNQVKIVNQAITKVFSKVQDKFANLSSILTDFRNTISSSYSGMLREVSQVHKVQLLHSSLMSKITHSIYRVEVLDQCRALKLPAVLVPPSKLKTELDQLEEIIGNDGYQLAVSAQEVQVYYHLPICSCQVFKDQMLLKIKVPLVKKEADWKLYDFLRIPFFWKNSICVIHHDTTFLAVSKNQITAVRGRALQDCRPYHDHLCFVPRYSGDAVAGAMCPKAVFEGNTAEKLAEVCSFSCQEGTQLIITQVGSERYFITNAYGKLELICALSKNETRLLGDKLYPGALDIIVPCDCRLQINDEVRVSETYPCDADSIAKFDIVRVIPAAWSKLKKLHFTPHSSSRQTIFTSFNDCLVEDWTKLIPHFNISLRRAESVDEDIVLKEPVGYENFWIRNLQSIALGLVIVVLTVIVFRNPFLIGINTIPRAAAESLDTVLALEIGSTVIIVALTLVFLCCVLWRFFRNRRNAEVSAPREPEGGESSSSIIGTLEDRMRGMERIPVTVRDRDGKKLSLWLTLQEESAI